MVLLRFFPNSKYLFQSAKSAHELFRKCERKYTERKFKVVPQINKPTSYRIMKFDSPQFKACITEETILLKDLFAKHGFEIRIVGGAVRDLLLGIQPTDLDFATTATPSEMKKIFEENEIRLINRNGERHGTITARINESNFEVTTLRIDQLTDGRHATVEFTKDWVLDANRRDLTVNAMYLGLDGTLYDYFNGYEDLQNRRVVFVGNADARIKEDYLRILRYFRFYGKIAEVPDNHDEDVLKAIKENAEGLLDISGERMLVEIYKIFQGKFIKEIVLKMLSLGVGNFIGFPENYNEAEFVKVCDRLKLKDVKAKPITYLCGLFRNEEEFNQFHLKMKLSNVDRDLGYFIINNREETLDPKPLRPYQILMLNYKPDYVFELLKYQGKFDLLEELSKWEIPKFPVKGTALKVMGIKGPAVGVAISRLKKIWYEHDFNMTEEELLKCVPQSNSHGGKKPKE